MHSAKSIRESADIVLCSLDSTDFLNAIKPSSCSILGYTPRTSIVHRIKSFDKARTLAIFLRKSLVSLMKDSTFCAKGLR